MAATAYTIAVPSPITAGVPVQISASPVGGNPAAPVLVTFNAQPGVSFSPNPVTLDTSGHSAFSTMTADSSGAYFLHGGSFTVTSSNNGGLTPPANVPVTVQQASSYAATVTVAPATITLLTGQSQQFNVSSIDQFGNPFPGVAVWSAQLGQINDYGMYLSPQIAGADTITATVGTTIGTAVATVMAGNYYATPALIQQIFGTLLYEYAFDPDNTGIPSTAALNYFLADATDRINSEMAGGPYAIPFTIASGTSLMRVPTWCAKIAYVEAFAVQGRQTAPPKAVDPDIYQSTWASVLEEMMDVRCGRNPINAVLRSGVSAEQLFPTVNQFPRPGIGCGLNQFGRVGWY